MKPHLSAARFCLPLLLLAGPALAEPIPPGVRAMVDTALASGDPAVIATVVAVAKKTAPGSAAELDALLPSATSAPTGLPVLTLAPTPPPAPAPVASKSPHWTGESELGGSLATGAAQAFDLYGGSTLELDGPAWAYKLSARGDYGETDGSRSAERALLSVQPRYKIDPVVYAFGFGQYEHDRLLGFRSRATVGGGVGLAAYSRPGLTVNLEAGPALRFTDFYGLDNRERVAARGSLNAKWSPFPAVTLKQDATLYAQSDDTALGTTTSLDTRLFGPVKARLSYDVRYERDVLRQQRQLDTISRLSFVYNY